jgi:site-specific recombinase
MDDIARPADVRVLVKEVAPAVPDAVAASLDRILSSMEPAGPLSARLETLESLVGWLQADREIELPPTAVVTGKTRAARLWILVEVLRASTPWRQALGRLVASVLVETSALKLFSRTGLPGELRIFSEAADRLARKLLPQPPDDTDLAALIFRLFPTEQRARWLEEAPPALVVELWALLLEGERGESAGAHVLDAAADAVALLAVRVATIGLEEDVRLRSGDTVLRASPFLELPKVCNQILEARAAKDWATRDQLRERVRDLVSHCREHLARVMTRLEEGSVSVDLVFRLELLGRLLDRIVCLRGLLDQGHADRAQQAVHFVKELVRDAIRDRSLGELVKSNSRLLARKIIERAGETGEHYITTTRGGWHAMVTSAAGGGFITAFCIAAKFLIAATRPAQFFEWLLIGANYAAGFLLMQALGFTLATKQPSMTAATLAAALDEKGRDGVDKLVDNIAATARSQLAAIIGNLGMVIPAAALITFAWRGLKGAHFLDEEKAKYVVESLHPFHSGTLIYAILTGVLLWSSSIIAGWVENWTVYRRLPEAIAQHRRLNRWLGPRRCRDLSRMFSRNISGIGGNTSFGFLLGGTAVIGRFFGVPLDVRHVTFSTGSLMLAGCALGAETVLTSSFGWAVLGVLGVAFFNFTVSFSLALSVALRARNVAFADVVLLAKALLVRMARRPFSFIFPPKDAPADPPAVH